MRRMGRFRMDALSGVVGTLVDGSGRPLARCYEATSAASRMIGLLATPDLRPDEALLIDRCRSVHTMGMRISIDVAFLDAEGVVLRVLHALRPFRVAAARGARSVIETRAETLADVTVGERLQVNRSLDAERLPARR